MSDKSALLTGEQTGKPERNYGIDLLRIVAIFFVCLLHAVGYGGIISKVSATSTPDHYRIAYFIEALTYCAVNVYAMISGFVGYNKKFKLSRYAMVWLELVFYCLVFTALTQWYSPQYMEENMWFKSFFPVMTREYWYMHAYFGMVILTPVLNAAIQKISMKSMTGVLLGGIVVYSALPIIMDVSVFNLNGGYSMLWLCIMYLAGGYFARLIKSNKKPHPLVMFGIFLFSVFATWFLKLNTDVKVLSYTSLTVVISGFSLLLTFSQLKIKGKIWQKIITFVAPSSLGIYLIHVHTFFWDNFLKGTIREELVKNFSSDSPLVMTLKIILAALVIFGSCFIVDLVRRGLFWVIHIKPLLQKLDRLLSKIGAGISKAFEKADAEKIPEAVAAEKISEPEANDEKNESDGNK